MLVHSLEIKADGLAQYSIKNKVGQDGVWRVQVTAPPCLSRAVLRGGGFANIRTRGQIIYTTYVEYASTYTSVYLLSSNDSELPENTK